MTTWHGDHFAFGLQVGPSPATGYRFTTGLGNLYPIRGGYGQEHEVINLYALTASDGVTPFGQARTVLLSGGQPPPSYP